MRIELNPDEINSKLCDGLEIHIKGYEGSPEMIDEANAQIFIESYEGKVRIHVWNDTVEPVTFELKKLDKKE